MDFIKFIFFLLFFAISLSFNSKQENAAPLSNETEMLLFEEIKDLKYNLSAVWKELQDTNDRLEQLENKDTSHCNETVTEELITFEVMTVRLREGEEDDDDDDDDDEEEDKNKEQNTKNENEKHDKTKETQHQIEVNEDEFPLSRTCPYMRRKEYEDYTAPEHKQKEENISAYCTMRPNKALPPEQRLEVHGKILLEQKDSETLVITTKISGMNILDKPAGAAHNVTTKHGFHVHQHGNLSNGCESAGTHFNPLNNTHGGPTTTHRHLGDFGNLESDLHGNINSRQVFKMEKALTGQHSLIGKALVIHAMEDDLGSNPLDNDSLTTGNSGKRLACCVIKELPV